MGKRAMKCCLLDTPIVLLNSQPLWLLGHHQARQHSSMYGRGSSEASLLVEELWTVDGCWGRGNYCSPELCLQVDCPYSGGGLQTHRHAGSANCTQEEEEHREQEEESMIAMMTTNEGVGRQCVGRSRIRGEWEGRVGSTMIEVHCIYV